MTQYFGVFVWNENVRHYTEENALYIYVSHKLAEKKAESLNLTKNVHVVRTVNIEVENE